jgi:hypothetical protein
MKMTGNTPGLSECTRMKVIRSGNHVLIQDNNQEFSMSPGAKMDDINFRMANAAGDMCDITLNIRRAQVLHEELGEYIKNTINDEGFVVGRIVTEY